MGCNCGKKKIKASVKKEPNVTKVVTNKEGKRFRVVPKAKRDVQ